MGGETCGMKVKVTTNEDKRKPPVTGWQYFGGGKWQSDPTLVCSSKLTSVCSEVFVELRGAAKEKHPECGGRYLPVKGKHNRGRWVSVCQHHLFKSNRKLNFYQSYFF